MPSLANSIRKSAPLPSMRTRKDGKSPADPLTLPPVQSWEGSTTRSRRRRRAWAGVGIHPDREPPRAVRPAARAPCGCLVADAPVFRVRVVARVARSTASPATPTPSLVSSPPREVRSAARAPCGCLVADVPASRVRVVARVAHSATSPAMPTPSPASSIASPATSLAQPTPSAGPRCADVTLRRTVRAEFRVSLATRRTTSYWCARRRRRQSFPMAAWRRHAGVRNLTSAEG